MSESLYDVVYRQPKLNCHVTRALTTKQVFMAQKMETR